jgi:hypothetical protein
MMGRFMVLITAGLLMTAMLAILGAGTAAADPHFVSNLNHD